MTLFMELKAVNIDTSVDFLLYLIREHWFTNEL